MQRFPFSAPRNLAAYLVFRSCQTTTATIVTLCDKYGVLDWLPCGISIPIMTLDVTSGHSDYPKLGNAGKDDSHFAYPLHCQVMFPWKDMLLTGSLDPFYPAVTG